MVTFLVHFSFLIPKVLSFCIILLNHLNDFRLYGHTSTTYCRLLSTSLLLTACLVTLYFSAAFRFGPKDWYNYTSWNISCCTYKIGTDGYFKLGKWRQWVQSLPFSINGLQWDWYKSADITCRYVTPHLNTYPSIMYFTTQCLHLISSCLFILRDLWTLLVKCSFRYMCIHHLRHSTLGWTYPTAGWDD